MRVVSDDPAQDDKDILGRNVFAKEIAKGLLFYSKQQKNGITLSITGEWGSGKSTLLSFLKNELASAEGTPFKIISFNPWMFYKSESIKLAFLLELALELKDFETTGTKLSKKIEKMVATFGWLKNVNPTAGTIQQGLQDLLKYFSKNQGVSEIKNEIEDILGKSKKKIVVLMDDIDRLMPEQIMEIFQIISLVTDFSNIIYILAFDKKIVIESIGKFFSAKGEDYLEKIIQIDYELPKIMDEKLSEIFTSYTSQIQKSHKITFDTYAIKSLWDYHGLKQYFKNIRDFKRFFNTLSFRLPSIAEEVNVTDFIIVEAIRIFDYTAYENLYAFYSFNLRKRNLSQDILTAPQWEFFKSPTSDLLKALFPTANLQSHRNDNNLKRLHDPAYFERYFSLLKSSNDIGEKDLRELIQRPQSRNGLLNEAANYNRIENLIKRLNDRDLAKNYPQYDITLIGDLISFFNINSSLFELYSDRISDMIINLLCINQKKDDLIKAFFATFGNAVQPVSIVHIYFFYYIKMFIKENRDFRSDHKDFDLYYKEHIDYIENSYSPIFKNALFYTSSSEFTKKAPFTKYQYQSIFAQLFPTEYFQYFDNLIKDTDYALYLAKMCMWINDSDNKLVRYEIKRNTEIYPESLFVTLYHTIAKIEDATLDERQKTIKKYFLALDISNYPNIKYPTV